MTVAKTPYITYDPEAKAAYVRLNNNKIAKTEEYSDEINIDFDTKGHVVGVEFLWVKPMRITIRRQINELVRRFHIPTLRNFHPEKLEEVYSLS